MKIVLLLLIFSQTTFAKWAIVENFPFMYLEYSKHVKIKSDGSQKITTVEFFKINQEAAFPKFQKFVLIPSDEEVIKVIEAKVINGNTDVRVPLEQIIVKDSFDIHTNPVKEVHISFPAIAVGAKVYLKYESEKKAILPNHFSSFFPLNLNTMLANFSLTFESDKPLNFRVNDPYSLLKVKSWKNVEKSMLSFTLSKPHHEVLDEEAGVPSLRSSTFVNVTTDRDWKYIHDVIRAKIESHIAKKLPKEFDKILSKARLLPNDKEKIKFLLEEVQAKIKFNSHFQPKDYFNPRTFDQIFTSQNGNSIELSIVLISLLRAVNVKAELALTTKSPPKSMRLIIPEIPLFKNFNHVLVKYSSLNEVLFIDPAEKLLPRFMPNQAIANRFALVLDGKFQVEKIPKVQYDQNGKNIERVSTFNSLGQVNVKVVETYSGYNADELNRRIVRLPKKVIEMEMLSKATLNDRPEKVTFTEPEVSQTGIDSVTIGLEYQTRKAGDGISDKFNPYFFKQEKIIEILQTDMSHRVGDLFVSIPEVIGKKSYMINLFTKVKPFVCQVKTDWLDYQRQVEAVKDGTVISEKIAYKKAIIENSEFKSKEFLAFQKELSECANMPLPELVLGGNHQFIIAGRENIFKSLTTAEKVEKRYLISKSIFIGDKVHSLYELSDIKDLLLQNIKDNPLHGSSYRLLSEYMMKTNPGNAEVVSEMQAMLLKGLKLNPGHQDIYFAYLKTLFFQGKRDLVQKGLPYVYRLSPIKNAQDMISFAEFFAMVGDEDRSINCYEKAVEMSKVKSDKLKSLTALGNRYAYAKENMKCANLAKEALKIEIENVEAQNLASKCLGRIQKFDEAIVFAREGHKKFPSESLSLNLAQSLVNRGNDLLVVKQIELAESDFKESTHYFKTSAAYLGLAKIAYKYRGQFDPAYHLVQEGMGQMKTDVEKKTHLRQAVEIFANDAENSAKMYQELIAITPYPPEKVSYLASLAIQQNNLNLVRESQETINAAIKIGEEFLLIKSSLPLMATIGELYFKKLDYEKSKAMLKKVGQLDPSNKIAQDYLTKIDVILTNYKRAPASTPNSMNTQLDKKQSPLKKVP